MFFPSGMNGMDEWQEVGNANDYETVMNARRLRAAQQINELRMLQQATGNTTRSNGFPTLIQGLNMLGSVSTSLSRESSQYCRWSRQPAISSQINAVLPPRGFQQSDCQALDRSGSKLVRNKIPNRLSGLHLLKLSHVHIDTEISKGWVLCGGMVDLSPCRKQKTGMLSVK
jgi:hypothetical protein